MTSERPWEMQHPELTSLLAKVRERLGEANFPGRWLLRDCTASQDLIASLRRKYNIRGGAEFSKLLHEKGWPEHEMFPACQNCQRYVREWRSGYVHYCSHVCEYPPCADKCGAERPERPENPEIRPEKGEGTLVTRARTLTIRALARRTATRSRHSIA